MKIINRNFIISIVTCAVFCLLSTGIIQPVQTVNAMKTNDISTNTERFMEALSNLSVEKVSELDDTYLISVGNITMTIEVLENYSRLSTVLDDSEILTYEIATESRSISDIVLENSSSENAASIQEVLIVNGTETFTLPTKQSAIPTSIIDVNNPSNPRGGGYPDTYYWWDNVHFIDDGGHTIKYTHPYKADPNYHLSAYNSEYLIGNQLIHYQFDKYTSNDILIGGPTVFAAAILAAISAITVNPAIVIGAAIIGAGLGYWIGNHVQGTFADEDDCLWVWFNKEFPEFMIDNVYAFELLYAAGGPMWSPMYISDEIAIYLCIYGYFRTGPITVFGGLFVGDPTPPPAPPVFYHVSNVTNKQTYGSGSVTNENGIIGSNADGNRANIYGVSSGSGGQIIGQMNATAYGRIFVHVQSATGYNTKLHTYVSYNNYYDWTETYVQTIADSAGGDWYYCGSYYGDFRYIGLAAINDGTPANIYIDAVIVKTY